MLNLNLTASGLGTATTTTNTTAPVVPTTLTTPTVIAPVVNPVTPIVAPVTPIVTPVTPVKEEPKPSCKHCEHYAWSVLSINFGLGLFLLAAAIYLIRKSGQAPAVTA